MYKQILTALAAVALAAPASAVTLDLEEAVERALQTDPRISEREHLVDAARGLLQEALGSDDVFLDVNTFLAVAPGTDDGFFAGEGFAVDAREVPDFPFCRGILFPLVQLPFELLVESFLVALELVDLDSHTRLGPPMFAGEILESLA